MGEVEAKMLSRSAKRAAEARLELSRASLKFPLSLVWLAPGIAMAVFGESLQHTLAANSHLVWLLAALVTGLSYASGQLALLQRKVDALTQLLAERGDA